MVTRGQDGQTESEGVAGVVEGNGADILPRRFSFYLVMDRSVANLLSVLEVSAVGPQSPCPKNRPELAALT